MHIRAGYDIIYDCPGATPLMLMLHVRPERMGDLITEQVMIVEPAVPTRQYNDQFGNICTRLVAPPGPIRFTAGFIIADSGRPDLEPLGAIQHPVDDLPSDILIYLLGSRYCETDRLSQEAWRLFGDTQPGWSRVTAILRFVNRHISFGYHHARNTRTASEAYDEGVGVCRDYAHLALTLCRCMNIPARYCTGYLGDIGVPIDGVMDFSAWFEVYLSGAWHTADARHHRPRIGRICMAQGRDATDTAISTSFGPNLLRRFEVITEQVA